MTENPIIFYVTCGVILSTVLGKHGFHVHESFHEENDGDLGDKCENVGGHFNPHQVCEFKKRIKRLSVSKAACSKYLTTGLHTVVSKAKL